MGGRGSSGGMGGGNLFSVMGTDGTKIDLTGIPLQFGKNDPNVTGAVRATVDAWENKRYKSKIEFGMCVDENGVNIEEKRGGHGSVRPTAAKMRQSVVFSHVHPRTDGLLGGTFSEGDLINFVAYSQASPGYLKFAGTQYAQHFNSGKMTTFRATAAEGTYSISKTSRLDGKGLLSYYKGEEKRLRSMCESEYKQLQTDYSSGKISYAEMSDKCNYSFNKFLVGLHNTLLNGQKKYGYTYTLERR